MQIPPLLVCGPQKYWFWCALIALGVRSAAEKVDCLASGVVASQNARFGPLFSGIELLDTAKTHLFPSEFNAKVLGHRPGMALPFAWFCVPSASS